MQWVVACDGLRRPVDAYAFAVDIHSEYRNPFDDVELAADVAVEPVDVVGLVVVGVESAPFSAFAAYKQPADVPASQIVHLHSFDDVAAFVVVVAAAVEASVVVDVLVAAAVVVAA